MSSKRRVTNSILAAGLLATAGLAWAQAPAYTAEGHGSQAQMTDDQARQVDELRGQYEKELLTLETELAAAEVELDEALAQPNADTDRVLALRREVRNREGQLEDQYLRANAEVARVMGVRPGTTFRGVDPLAHGWAPGWRDSCSWGGCPWHAGRMGGHRENRWWRPASWMGRSDALSDRGRCCQ